MSKKILYIALILILACNNLLAQTSFIFDIRTDNYPEIKGKYFYLDKDNVAQNIPRNKILLHEGLKNILNFNWENNDLQMTNNLSIICAQCISQSMEGLPIEYSKMFYEEMSNILDFSKNEISVSAFNYYNYILRDFSEGNTDLVKLFNGIELFGGIDYRNAFFDEPAGIFKFMDYAKYKPVIILLTNGSGFVVNDDIQKEAIKRGIKIYCLAFNDGASESLREFVNGSGGIVFENLNLKSDIARVCKLILTLETYNNPTEFSYISKSCDSKKDINIQETQTGVFANLGIAVVSDEQLSSLEYLEDNSIYFGDIPIGAENKAFIGIKALRDTITITNIFPSDSRFTIDTIYPLIIPTDSLSYIKINYKASKTGFAYCSFNVISDACSNKNFFATAGSYDIFSGDKTLSLLSPKGGEKYISGADTSILWTGIPPDIPVKLEYSTDAGKSWIEIVGNAYNLKYNWKNIPNTPSDECLMKATQLTKNITKDKILIIDASQKEIFDIIWLTKRNSILTASTVGDIQIWDAKTGARVRSCFSGLNNLSAIGLIDDSLAVYANSGENVYIFKLDSINKIEDFVSQYGSQISTFSQGVSGSQLLVGDAAGNVSMWNIYNKERKYKIVAHSIKVSSIVYSPDGRKFATSAGNEVKIWHTSNGNNFINLPPFAFYINSITFSNDGTQLIIATFDGRIISWDLIQNKELWSKLYENTPVFKVAMAPDTSILAFSTDYRNLDLLETKENISFFNYKFHTSNVNEIEWDNSTGDLRIASSDKKGFIHIWYLKDLPFYNIKLQDDISNYWNIYERKGILSSINFGRQVINIAKDSILWAGFINNTLLPIKIDSVRITGIDKDVFKVFFPEAYFVKSNYPVKLFYEFTPPDVKKYIADIELFSAGKKFTSKISGEGVNAMTSINPKIINYGKVIANSISEKFTEITNNSDIDIQIDSVVLVDNNKAFKCTSSDKYVLNSKKSEKISFEFNPKFIQRYSAYAKVYNSSNHSPIIIQLNGEGIESTIINDADLEFDDFYCNQEPIIDSIKISNLGFTKINLLKPTMTNNNKEAFDIDINQIFPITIEAQESKYIRFNFYPQKQGLNFCDVELTYELNNSFINKFIRMSGYKKETKLIFNPNIVNFNTNINETKSNNVKAYNIGNTIIKLNLPFSNTYFDINTIDKSSISPGDSCQLKIDFKGSAVDTNISYIYSFLDSCKKETKLLLAATIGLENAIADIPLTIDYGTLKCPNSNILKEIIIRNTGTSSLVVNELLLSDKVNFSLGSENGFLVPPGETKKIEVLFEPKSLNSFNVELILKTNAINFAGGEIRIKLQAKSKYSFWGIDIDTLVFDGVLENRASTKVFEISNLSNESIKIYFSDLNNYQVKSPQPTIIKAFEKANIIVDFLGGVVGNNYFEKLIISDSCGIAKELNIYSKIRSFAEVGFKIPLVKGSVGDTVKIPIKLYSPEDIELPKVESYNITLSFNASLLYNFNQSIKDSIYNNTRFVKLNSVQSIPNADSIIYELRLIAMLTDTNKSLIKFEDITPNGKNVSMITENGEFNLINVCGDGISNTGVLFLAQNEPNPAINKTTIKYSLIEKGEYSLELYDYSGKLIDILEKGRKKPGTYETTINTNKYNIGTYYYVLRTNTSTLIKKMIIVK